jgi:hypothetical protein
MSQQGSPVCRHELGNYSIPFSADESPLTEEMVVVSTRDASASPSQEPTARLIWPGVYHDKKRNLQEIDKSTHGNVKEYIAGELDVSRLNVIYKHLWYAGLKRTARPLHHQALIGRTIVITEQADLHLTWQGSRIFIKPLPNFLLCYTVWQNHLCRDSTLLKDARGLLLSYVWLIRHESDFKIALDKGLVSPVITWEKWVTISGGVVRDNNCHSLSGINPRYQYGELRLARLNDIYRLCSKTRNKTNFIRGYLYGYYEYSTFFQRNTSWLVASVVYIALVLTAMQVGLATPNLNNNRTFQNASYGFTVFSILAPLVALGAVGATVLVLVIINFRYARSRHAEKGPENASSPAGKAPDPFMH